MDKGTESIAQELERCLRLRTKPVAVRMIREEKEIPDGAIRPLRDLSSHMSLCQAFSQARRRGMTIAMLKEDNWCFEPVVGLGLAAPPQEFLDGWNRYPGTAKTLKAGSRWASQMPRFATGEYVGIVVSPLDQTRMEPDLIIVYCDPSQLTQIMIAVNWIDGNDVTSVLSGHAACVYAIVPAVHNRNFQVTVPCIGDRKRAVAQETEMMFSLPWKRSRDLVDGLKALEQDGSGLPIGYSIQLEYPLEESYVKFGRMVGLRIRSE